MAAPAAADLRDARGRAAEAVLRRRAAARGGGRDAARDARAPARRRRPAARDGAGGAENERRPLPADGAAGGDRVQRVVRRLVRADGEPPARRRRREKEQLMFDSLARLADRHARRIGLLAIAFFLLAGAARRLGRHRLDPYGADDPATETVEGAGTAATTPACGCPRVIVVVEDAPVAEPGDAAPGRSARTRAAAPRRRRVGQRLLRHPLPRLRLQRRPLHLPRGRPEADRRQGVAGSRRRHRRRARRTARASSVGGAAVAQEQVNKQVEKDLRTGGDARLPAALPALPALLPQPRRLAAAGDDRRLLAIVGTFLILRIASEFGSISIFALNLTTGLGLGLAIDYSLFIVSRYREEIAKDGPGLAAMRRVMATAGRTVFFSSLTVAAALASLLVFPQRFLYSMGLGGSLVALLAALISLTVLPAVLTLLGTRVNSLAPRFLQRRAEADTRPDEHGFWYRLSRFVMRRPIPIATLSAALPDRPRAPLLRDQVQHRRPDRAAEGGQRPPGLRHGQRASSRPTARRRSGSSVEGGDAAAARRAGGAGPPAPTASPRSLRRSRLRGRRHRDPGGLGEPVQLRRRARRP